MPTISASSFADACFGQGFAHGQDRLWQLELHRRVASGRLAELLGASALSADRFLRRLGLRRAAEAEAESLLPIERTVLDAYVGGINAAIAAADGALPPEFRLLRIVPEPWTAVDALAWAKTMAFTLAGNADAELLRARLAATVGDDARWFDVAGRAAAASAAAGAERLQALIAEAARFLPLGLHGASNAWAIAGARSASGAPLLASDPHLPLSLPPAWYPARLMAPEFDLLGAGIPGCPLLQIGRTRQVAWGLTTANADVQDWYLERFDPERPTRYRVGDDWHEATVRVERIAVRGAPAVDERVLSTRHGPVLIEPSGPGPAWALRWIGHTPGHGVAAIAGMAQARDARAFRDALRLWHAPAQNVVFADRHDIGWVMAGTLPRRRGGDGSVPVPGWTGEHDWVGVVPFDELPQAWNPPEGVVVSANQRPPGPPVAGHDFASDWRARRIHDLLAARERLTLADCAAIQRDVHALPGLALLRHCAALRLDAATPAGRALAAWRGWDGAMRPDSVGAAISAATLQALARAVLVPRLGEPLAALYLGSPSLDPTAAGGQLLGRATTLLVEALEAREAGFLRAIGADSWGALLEDALRAANEDLTSRLGPDPRRWRWGRLHRLAPRHGFADAPWIGRLFRVADIPIGGDTDTVQQTAVLPHRPYAARSSAPSWRFLVDLGDPDGALAALPGGQSGHPASPHWRDGWRRWRSGTPQPLIDPDAGTARVLVLEP